MDVTGLTSSAARPTTKVEPQLTLWGHSAAITRLIHAPTKQFLHSASLDSSIRVRALPSAVGLGSGGSGPGSWHNSTYAPYDETRARGELVGHSDAVWDLALVRDESTLIGCGLEGSVKVWNVCATGTGVIGSLKLAWSWAGLGWIVRTTVGRERERAWALVLKAAGLITMAYQNAVAKIFDIESGKEVVRLQSDMSYDGTPATQINRIVSHPTMPLLITAHEDNNEKQMTAMHNTG